MNKLLVLVYVPRLEQEYDILIPINKKVGTIKQIIINSIYELSDGSLEQKGSFQLFDKETGRKYENDVYVKDSGILNGTKLILL